MNTTFCPECGRANQYSTEKPNFCSFCAKPLTISASAQPAYRPAPPRREEPLRHHRNDDRYNSRANARYEDDRYSDERDIPSKDELIDRFAGISLKPTEKPQRPGETMNLGQVFSMGAVGVKPVTGHSETRSDESTTYHGGDRTAYLDGFFGQNMKEKRIDAAEGR